MSTAKVQFERAWAKIRPFFKQLTSRANELDHITNTTGYMDGTMRYIKLYVKNLITSDQFVTILGQFLVFDAAKLKIEKLESQIQEVYVRIYSILFMF